MWAVYLFNRLWQQSLQEDAAAAIAAATDRGLTLTEPGYRPRLVAEGVLDGRAVRLEWRGGAMGGRTLLTVDGEGRWRALITDAEELQVALAAHQL